MLLALLVDRLWGELPAQFHPVVWMGHYLARAGRNAVNRVPWLSFALGTLYWCLGAALVGTIYMCVAWLLTALPAWANILLTAAFLKPLFALRMLLTEVKAVEDALGEGLLMGRERLAMIVSRDTSALNSDEIRESALESLAENLSDSVIAPLFWFALFGLPGAAVYRFANTADAMWGYRGRWEWAGKFAARMDDVLNLVPARLTALAVLLLGAYPMRLLRRLPGEAARTASPNSGWPMGAIAMSLNIRLSKPRLYVLNETAPTPSPPDVLKALARAERVAWMIVVLFTILCQCLSLPLHV